MIWMTHDIIKLMYERDHVHKIMARLPWSTESNVYYQGAKECPFQLCSYTLQKWPPNMWLEIKPLVPGKNKHPHITCDISANDFNHHFTNISNKMNSNFLNFYDNFFLQRSKKKVFVVFVSSRCLMKILKHIWDLYLINPIIIYWVWASFYWENQPNIFLYHWKMW